MLKKASKIISIFLCVLVLFTMLAACGQKTNTGGTKQNGEQTSNNENNNNSQKETITFKIFRNRSAPEYPEDGGMGRQVIIDWAKERGVTGVDFKVELASGDDYFTKLNLLAASGDLPDYFDVDLKTMYRFANEGLILQLDDLAKIMKNAQKFWKEADLDAATYEGKLYGFPVGYRLGEINQPAVGTFVIRQDWLDNLGLKKPETLDDYYEVIKAFTFNDPDKNGKDDTFGMGGSNQTYFEAVFGAFGVSPGPNGVSPYFWIERDGVLKQGSTLPEAKEALKVLQKWYAEGLIDPEFMIIDKKQMEEKVVNSKIGFYPLDVWHINPDTAVNKALVEQTPGAVLVAVNPPIGPNGQRGWPEPMPGSKFTSIAASCKDPELLARFIDTTLDDSPDERPFVTEGIEGVHWTYDRENNVVNVVPNIADQFKDGFSQPVQFIKVTDRRWITSDRLKEALKIANSYTIKNEYWKNVPAMIDYPDLEKLWQEYFVKIVSGELPVDAWDEYVQKFYSQGGSEIEKQVNEAWQSEKN